MSRIIRTAPGLGRGGLLGNTEGPEAYLRALDTLPSQFCRATGGTETVINQSGRYYRVHTYTDTDPTSLLLNFDGANGSTTFTDDSGWGHAVTANGDAEISTTQSKFGGSSAYFDGTGDYLKVSSNSTLAFGTADFTAEFFFRLSAIVNANQNFLDTDVSGGFSLYYNGPDGYFGGANSFRISNRVVNLITQSQALSTGIWYHLAVSRSSGTLRLFLDGTQIASVADTTNFAQGDFYIGGANGYIDSLRITKGQALYTSAFTPPTTALTRVGSGSLTFTRGGAVEYLVVGGGGGGGVGEPNPGGDGGGGGGGGGFRSGKVTTAAMSATVNVGGGGAGGATAQQNGASGSDSEILGITASGGGGGGGDENDGVSGGSGGGSGSRPFTTGTGGSGNTPPTSPPQGYSGGDDTISTGLGRRAAAGGGGAGGDGGDNANYVAGVGGVGASSPISGTSSYYAGGGGGGGETVTPVSGGAGGSGGGGNGGSPSQATGGTANTGGGGGGGTGAGSGSVTSANYGGSGGSGIVIARYRITQAEYEAEAA